MKRHAVDTMVMIGRGEIGAKGLSSEGEMERGTRERSFSTKNLKRMIGEMHIIFRAGRLFRVKHGGSVDRKRLIIGDMSGSGGCPTEAVLYLETCIRIQQ